MTTFLILLTAMMAIFPLCGEDLRDLTHLKQDFVLETKRIKLPEFPDAFNPSIVRWQGNLLMSFRTYDPETHSTDLIGFVWLDDNFNPISTPTLLVREDELTAEISEAKDPRLLVVGHDLLMIYSNLYPFDTPISRMMVGKVEILDDGSFKISSPSSLIQYDGEIPQRKEKNWVPFAYHNMLVLAYSIQPHRLLIPLPGSDRCISLASSIGTIKWEWGNLMGGTPAIRVDDFYLSFFHTNKAMASVQSHGQVMNHYFMGAYTFEGQYPFAVTGISHHPIVAKTFYEGPMYTTWKPLRVIFPSGLIVEGNDIWVSYGRQDHEMWVVKFDKAKLLASLKPVTTLYPYLP